LVAAFVGATLALPPCAALPFFAAVFAMLG
jgi:hypothetical protein